MTYWINTVSADHVQRGVAGGFTQANHGKPDMLRRMSRGDWIIFYSPKTVYPDGAPLQAFTAIGRVADDEPYQADVSPDVQPWRRNVDFLDCVETPIRPLIDHLHFIEDTSRWGYKFRFGVFRIDDHGHRTPPAHAVGGGDRGRSGDHSQKCRPAIRAATTDARSDRPGEGGRASIR